MAGLADDFDGSVFPRFHALSALPDVRFVREARRSGEDAAGVNAVELAGFGRRVEELGKGHAVNGKVVDRFVRYRGVFQRCGGNHGVYGFCVGKCQRFVLSR